MHTPRLVFLLLFGAALTHAGTIVAQSHDTATDKNWQVTAGAGVITRPDFPGSDSQEVLPVGGEIEFIA